MTIKDYERNDSDRIKTILKQAVALLTEPKAFEYQARVKDILKHELNRSLTNPDRPRFTFGDSNSKSKPKTFSSIQDNAGLFDEVNQKLTGPAKPTEADKGIVPTKSFFNFESATKPHSQGESEDK